MVSADTFFQHMDAFVDYRKVIYETSDQTIKSNNADLKLFQDFIHGKPYEVINGPAVMDFQYYLKKDRANCGGSINRKIFTLRAYSNFLKLQCVPQSEGLPFRDVLKIRGGYRNRPDALGHREIKKFFDSIDRSTFLGIRDYAVYALMYLLGLRVGEVFGLNLESIDFENNTITVVGKGNRRRALHLTAEMAQVLSEWIAVRKHFCNSDQNNALFISKKGNRLAIRTMQDNFKKIVSKADLKTHFNITCHTMRHSFASHLNDEDTDILIIQGLMGHASPRSAQAYIHPSQEKIRQALEKLPGVIYMNKLVEEDVLHLKFQSPFRPKKE
jgi:site-specific recombinase XerD